MRAAVISAVLVVVAFVGAPVVVDGAAVACHPAVTFYDSPLVYFQKDMLARAVVWNLWHLLSVCPTSTVPSMNSTFCTMSNYSQESPDVDRYMDSSMWWTGMQGSEQLHLMLTGSGYLCSVDILFPLRNPRNLTSKVDMLATIPTVVVNPTIALVSTPFSISILGSDDTTKSPSALSATNYGFHLGIATDGQCTSFVHSDTNPTLGTAFSSSVAGLPAGIYSVCMKVLYNSNEYTPWFPISAITGHSQNNLAVGYFSTWGDIAAEQDWSDLPDNDRLLYNRNLTLYMEAAIITSNTHFNYYTLDASLDLCNPMQTPTFSRSDLVAVNGTHYAANVSVTANGVNGNGGGYAVLCGAEDTDGPWMLLSRNYLTVYYCSVGYRTPAGGGCVPCSETGPSPGMYCHGHGTCGDEQRATQDFQSYLSYCTCNVGPNGSDPSYYYGNDCEYAYLDYPIVSPTANESYIGTQIVNFSRPDPDESFTIRLSNGTERTCTLWCTMEFTQDPAKPPRETIVYNLTMWTNHTNGSQTFSTLDASFVILPPTGTATFTPSYSAQTVTRSVSFPTASATASGATATHTSSGSVSVGTPSTSGTNTASESKATATRSLSPTASVSQPPTATHTDTTTATASATSSHPTASGTTSSTKSPSGVTPSVSTTQPTPTISGSASVWRTSKTRGRSLSGSLVPTSSATPLPPTQRTRTPSDPPTRTVTPTRPLTITAECGGAPLDADANSTIVVDVGLPMGQLQRKDGGITAMPSPRPCNVRCADHDCRIRYAGGRLPDRALHFDCNTGALALTDDDLTALAALVANDTVSCNLSVPVRGPPVAEVPVDGAAPTAAPSPSGGGTPAPVISTPAAPPPPTFGPTVPVGVSIVLRAAPVELRHVWLPDVAPRQLPMPLLIVDYHPVPLLLDMALSTTTGGANTTTPTLPPLAINNRTVNIGYGTRCDRPADATAKQQTAVFDGPGGAPISLVIDGADVSPLVVERMLPGRCLSFRAHVSPPTAFLPTDSTVVLPPFARGHQNAPPTTPGGGDGFGGNGNVTSTPPVTTAVGGGSVAPTSPGGSEQPTTVAPGGTGDGGGISGVGADGAPASAAEDASLLAALAESPNMPRCIAAWTFAAAAAVCAAYAARLRPKPVTSRS